MGSNGVRAKGGLPAAAELGVTEMRVGGGSGVVGVDMVNDTAFEVPTEFDTFTIAEPGNAVSTGVTAAVS